MTQDRISATPGPLRPPWSARLAHSYCTQPAVWLVGLLLTLLPCLFLSLRLPLKSDFRSLLPPDKPSVRALDAALQRIGGTNTLNIAVEGDDPLAMERFITDLSQDLAQLPPGTIRYMEHEAAGVQPFLQRNKFLFLDLADLRDLLTWTQAQITSTYRKQNPLYVELEDAAPVDPEFLGHLEKKYDGRGHAYRNFRDGFFFSADQRLAVILLYPEGSATQLREAKALMKTVQALIAKRAPASYHPSMRVRLTGQYLRALFEYDQIVADAVETLGLCLTLVAAVIYLYFRKWRAVPLLCVALLAGTVWTFALTRLVIGHLNSQTAFLGSILVGNGVNSGIILFARYLEERRQGIAPQPALATALAETWKATLTAALTTSAAFAALAISEIRGFSEFGFIGGVGMMFCWLGTYLALPPLLAVSERLSSLAPRRTTQPGQWQGLMNPLAGAVSRWPRQILLGIGLLLIPAVVLSVRFLPTSLEYDFSKLRNRPNPNSSDEVLTQRVTAIFGQYMTPALLLTNSAEQSEQACASVQKLIAAHPEEGRTVKECRTLRSYLPQEQPQKLALLAELRGLITKHHLRDRLPAQAARLDELLATATLQPVHESDMPTFLQQRFRERSGALGHIGYVYPGSDVHLSNGHLLIQFTDLLDAARLADGTKPQLAGETFIFGDLLSAVRHDGPRATGLAALAVATAVALVLRRPVLVLGVLGTLAVSFLVLFGAQSALAIKLNFFNFIALPVTLGIGVDYSVNVLLRYHFVGRGGMPQTIRVVGGAVLLCSLTTTIGYATMLIGRNQALASFGWLALLGELCCLSGSLLFLPAAIQALEKKPAARD